MSRTSLSNYSRERLHERVVRAFSEDELRNLAFYLDLDYECLTGGGKTGKTGFARELILALERQGRIPEFLEVLSRARPSILWDDLLPALPVGDSIRGCYLPSLGEVIAGPYATLGDDLEYCGEPDWSGALDQTILIPQIPPNAKVAVVRVKGTSMMDEHVCEGDLLLVDLANDSRRLRENRMIVTWYLSEQDAALAGKGDFHDIVKSGNLPLRGPTLKIFKGQYRDADGTLRYRLGRIKDDGEHNQNEIIAVVIRPVGRVLALHRVLG